MVMSRDEFDAIAREFGTEEARRREREASERAREQSEQADRLHREERERLRRERQREARERRDRERLAAVARRGQERVDEGEASIDDYRDLTGPVVDDDFSQPTTRDFIDDALGGRPHSATEGVTLFDEPERRAVERTPQQQEQGDQTTRAQPGPLSEEQESEVEASAAALDEEAIALGVTPRQYRRMSQEERAALASVRSVERSDPALSARIRRALAGEEALVNLPESVQRNLAMAVLAIPGRGGAARGATVSPRVRAELEAILAARDRPRAFSESDLSRRLAGISEGEAHARGTRAAAEQMVAEFRAQQAAERAAQLRTRAQIGTGETVVLPPFQTGRAEPATGTGEPGAEPETPRRGGQPTPEQRRLASAVARRQLQRVQEDLAAPAPQPIPPAGTVQPSPLPPPPPAPAPQPEPQPEPTVIQTPTVTPTPGPGPAPAPGPQPQPEPEPQADPAPAPAAPPPPAAPAAPSAPAPSPPAPPAPPATAAVVAAPAAPTPRRGKPKRGIRSRVTRGRHIHVANFRDRQGIYATVNTRTGTVTKSRRVPLGGVRPGATPEQTLKVVRRGSEPPMLTAVDLGAMLADLSGETPAFTPDPTENRNVSAERRFS